MICKFFILFNPFLTLIPDLLFGIKSERKNRFQVSIRNRIILSGKRFYISYYFPNCLKRDHLPEITKAKVHI